MLTDNYGTTLKNHYEAYFGVAGKKYIWFSDPHKKSHPDFYVLAFEPNPRHNMWTYCTVGMSLDRDDENLVELFVFAPQPDDLLIELLTVAASYHKNEAPLNLHHTFNIGRPWLPGSLCDYGFISLPYLDGPVLEIFFFDVDIIHCYWIIPVTKQEVEYKITNGPEALEDLFENNGIDYLNPQRLSLL